MNDTIENLNINVKFNDNLGDAATRLNELAESITNVNTAAGKTSAIGKMSKQMESLNAKTSKLKTANTFKEIGESTKRASESTKGFIAKTSTAIVKVAVFMRALRTLSKFVLGGITDLNKLSLGIAHINTLFGEGADEVIRYARSVEKLMGIPMADFLSTQGTLGNMLSGFGVANEKVKDMSQSLTQLSFDLEAFNSLGLNQQQLLGMMQSGLSGYDKSLRRLGFALREVELQEILHRNGLDVKVSELNRAGKSQLVYMAIMEQSAKMGAMGALGRQAQSPIVAFNMLKNQVRILAQTLAGALLPVIMKTIQFLHALAMAATNVVVRIAALFGVQIKPIDFGGAMGGVSDYVDGLEDIAGNASGATKKIKELRDQMAGFDKLNVMKQEAPSTPSGGAGIGGLGGLDLDIPMPEYGDFLTDMTKDVQELAKVLEPILMILGAIAGFKLVGWLANIPIIAQFLGAIWEVLSIWGIWISEMGLVAGTLDLLAYGFSLILTPITLVILAIAAVVGAIVELWNTNDEFKEKVILAWTGIKDIISKVWNDIIKPIFDKIIAGGKAIWEESIKPLWDRWVEAFGKIAIAVLNLWNKHLLPFVSWAVDFFGPIILGAVDFLVAGFRVGFVIITTVIGTFMTSVGTIFAAIVDIFSELITFVKAVFTGDWEAAWEAVKNIFSIIKDTIITLVGDLWEGFKEGFNKILGIADELLQGLGINTDGIKDVFSNIIGFIKNVFTGDWKAAFENVIGIFKNLFGSIGGIFKQAWDGVLALLTAGGKIFSGVVKGIANIFATLVNSIIRGINTVISKPFNLVNRMLNSIRAISILGAKPFNKLWGQNPIPVPQVPTIPGYAVGTNYVTHDHIAQIHKGEAIIPEKFNDKKYFGQQNDEETKKLLKEQNNLLMKILEKDSTVRVSSSDIESAGTDYRRMLVKAKGGA